MFNYLNFKYIPFHLIFVHLTFYISHVLFRCHGEMGRSNGRSSVTADTKTHSTALDHKINGTLTIFNTATDMDAVSTVIKSVSEKLNEGTTLSLRAQKELSNELSKAAIAHDKYA